MNQIQLYDYQLDMEQRIEEAFNTHQSVSESAKRRRLLLVTSFFIASSSGIPSGVMLSTKAKPAFSSSSMSLTQPATSATGTPVCCPRISMRCGNLPMSVCRSAPPSPVMIRSAPFIFSSKPMISSSRSAPYFISAPRYCMKA